MCTRQRDTPAVAPHPSHRIASHRTAPSVPARNATNSLPPFQKVAATRARFEHGTTVTHPPKIRISYILFMSYIGVNITYFVLGAKTWHPSCRAPPVASHGTFCTPPVTPETACSLLAVAATRARFEYGPHTPNLSPLRNNHPSCPLFPSLMLFSSLSPFLPRTSRTWRLYISMSCALT